MAMNSYIVTLVYPTKDVSFKTYVFDRDIIKNTIASGGSLSVIREDYNEEIISINPQQLLYYLIIKETNHAETP